MKRLPVLLCVAAVPLLADCGGSPTRAQARKTDALGVAFSGPYRHENLEVFLVHGADAGPTRDYVPLAVALEQGLVEVTERSGAGGGAQVNTLQIRNKSDRLIWVQQGDVVKGGQQDRAIAKDLVVPPGGEPVDLAAFCVEQGRWSPRGGVVASGEATTVMFGAPDPNVRSVATKALKLAIQSGSQGEVWHQVAASQDRFCALAGKPIQAAASPSSYVLAMESGEVKKLVDGYVRALEGLAAQHADARGFAFAVNGAPSSIEVFASHALFARTWPKLLNAAAMEAASLAKEQRREARLEDVIACMRGAEAGAASTEQPNARLRLVRKEASGNVLAESWFDGDLVHASYLKK